MKKRIQLMIISCIEILLKIQYLFSKKKALKNAYLLFFRPQKKPLSQEEIVFLSNAKDRIICNNKEKIQTYRWKNNGKTILLVHGWESNSFRWKTLITELEKLNYNIVAFDAPAHGYSSGKQMNITSLSIGLQKTLTLYAPEILIGHSIGAMLAVFNQFKYPTHIVKKLILLAPPTNLKSLVSKFQITLRLSDEFMISFDQYFKKHMDYFFNEFSLLYFVKNIQLPSLIIHDEKDKIAPYIDTEILAQQWPSSTLISTQGLDHSLQSSKNQFQYYSIYNNYLSFKLKHSPF